MSSKPWAQSLYVALVYAPAPGAIVRGLPHVGLVFDARDGGLVRIEA